MNTYKQVKCKILASDETEKLERMINEFICEEIDECEVKDIKLSVTESFGEDWLYALILYY